MTGLDVREAGGKAICVEEAEGTVEGATLSSERDECIPLGRPGVPTEAMGPCDEVGTTIVADGVTEDHGVALAGDHARDSRGVTVQVRDLSVGEAQGFLGQISAAVLDVRTDDGAVGHADRVEDAAHLVTVVLHHVLVLASNLDVLDLELLENSA